MKLICPGVTGWAATTRSPSFSRSSSSRTMTNLRAAMAAIASGTVARLISRMLPAEVSSHVTRDDVSFEVDDRPAFVTRRDGYLEGVRDQCDSKRAGRLVYRCHGQADAVRGDRSFDRDEARNRGRKFDRDLASGRGALDGPHRAGGIDVALHEMTVQQ